MISYKEIALRVILILLSLGLFGCGSPFVKKEAYILGQVNQRYLSTLTNWSFQGRLAIKNKTKSWPATINWQHSLGLDIIKLGGFLGGEVLIKITASAVIIDQGGGHLEYLHSPDQLLEKKLGILISIDALKYWVIGLTQPEASFEAIAKGFTQSGWSVVYELMDVDGELLPRKMQASKGKAHLKLIFDQWHIDDD